METKIPNNLFENTLEKVKKELAKRLDNKLDLASDSDFVKEKFLNEIKKEYRRFEKDSLPIDLTLFVKAKDKQKENKNKNIDIALTEVFKENKILPIKNGIVTIATLLAYKNFIDDLENEIPNEDNEFYLESDEDEKKVKKEVNTEFTLKRQILAITYLLKNSGFKAIDNTTTARFIQFLTNRESSTKAIKNTRIYKDLRNTLSSKKQLLKDLDFILEHFKKLGLENIVNEINKDKNKK